MPEGGASNPDEEEEQSAVAPRRSAHPAGQYACCVGNGSAGLHSALSRRHPSLQIQLVSKLVGIVLII